MVLKLHWKSLMLRNRLSSDAVGNCWWKKKHFVEALRYRLE
ncbi:conserved hypothetical protein [delta proteobacterium NaphS2]|nr:conserved hypothetical protein [delta proteobacterium NaphS2]